MCWTNPSTPVDNLSGVFDNDNVEFPSASCSLTAISDSLIHVLSVDRERKEVDDESGELGSASGVEGMSVLWKGYTGGYI